MGVLVMTTTMMKTTTMAGRGSRVPTRWASWTPTVSLVVVAFSLALVLLLSGCEHDPTILETHPLDLVGATRGEVESFYLTMSDGVRVAVDTYVPQDYPAGGPYPTIFEMTRYWRKRGDEIPYTIRRAMQRGFAWVVMDERGTGASFGRWDRPLSDRALRDTEEVFDWIVEQGWSNGRVGATGISYSGMAAQQSVSRNHPALRAIVPMSDSYDLYRDLIFPGGVFNEAFLQGWSDAVMALDRSTSLSIDDQHFVLSPVDSDPEGILLQEAVDGHAGNLNPYEAFEGITYRDDPGLSGLVLDDLSTERFWDRIAESGIAVYHWGSWMDGGSADGVIRAFLQSDGPRRAAIGSWTHDLEGNSFTGDGDRYTAVPTFEAQWEELLNFFDDALRKDKPVGERVIRYYTMGEGTWKATSTWPVEGTVVESWYLGADSVLTPTPPSDPSGEDEYTVNDEVRSSIDPRWLGPLFSETWYPDRRERDKSLLTYESPPLATDMEVTGHPVVQLHLSSTHSDGTYIVYLEDVSSRGVVTYVTEGVLRGIHRKVSPAPEGWPASVPYHSFLSVDGEDQVPGEVFELTLALEPTSFLFRQDHRIRISIAGHDAAVFRRIPESGTPVLSIQRNSVYPSRIQIPVVRTPMG